MGWEEEKIGGHKSAKMQNERVERSGKSKRKNEPMRDGPQRKKGKLPTKKTTWKRDMERTKKDGETATPHRGRNRGEKNKKGFKRHSAT